jgi:hypothetical protein
MPKGDVMFKSSIKSMTDIIVIGEDQFFRSTSKDGSEKVVIQIPYYLNNGYYHVLKLSGDMPVRFEGVK